ncbi:MAG: hypothetical protein Satyrvirus28_7 [Satyrvirus sp.]|uniref:Uncharacterized protein n=1 Tax=Satyrvirus sp. TaxID=2487771 RepID=A0A3G5AJG0_9VIRU|nr:MAG: hypothetical protein Satyrvirus28_7 [Satyrvirus sp.]
MSSKPTSNSTPKMSTTRKIVLFVVFLFVIAIVIIIIIGLIRLIRFETGSPNNQPQVSNPQNCPSTCQHHIDCANCGANTLCISGQCATNPCANYSTCESIKGSNNPNCGWCFDNYGSNGYQGVAIPGDTDGATTGTCNAYVDQHTDCPAAQNCAAISSCTGIPNAASCGWCTNLNVALNSISGTGPHYTPEEDCGNFVNYAGKDPSSCPGGAV